MFRMCHQCLYYSVVVDVFVYVCVIKRGAVLESYSKLFSSDDLFMHLFICNVFHRGVFFLGLGLYEG